MSNSLNTPFSSTNSLLKASLGRDSVKIYILTVVTIGYSNTRGFPYCKSFLWITSLVFPRIACLIITVEPLSTTVSFFGRQSIHWLMFKPLYNSQFFWRTVHTLTLVWPSLQRPVFLADSPYIDSCLNLSTTANFYCPQGGHWGKVQLYLLKVHQESWYIHAEYHFQHVILNIKGLHWTLLMADLLATGLEFWISAVVLVYYGHLFFP